MQLDTSECTDLQKVSNLSNETSGLANEWYTSQDRFEFERAVLFEQNWFAVGFESAVPNAGDLSPVDMFGLPFLLVRDKNHELKVFHNVCSHRGITLVDRPTNTTSVIRCRYHSWCYGLDGSLRSTPHVGGPSVHGHDAVDKKGLGLKEVRSATFLGIVYVTLSSEAPNFEQYAASLIARWNEFRRARQFHSAADSTFDLTMNGNWKLVMENFLESYHLPWLHPGLNSYSRMEDHSYEMLDPVTAGQVSLAYRPRLSDDNKAFQPLKDVSSNWHERGEYLALYPNTMFGIHADHTFITILQPVSPSETREHVSLSYFDEASISEPYTELRKRNLDTWRSITLEDISAVEGMQSGRRSPGFRGGILTPVLERTTRHFHAWVANGYLGGYLSESFERPSRPAVERLVPAATSK